MSKVHTKEQAKQKIAIVGNPNCGKTTIFNFLAKQFEKIGNWAGVTVDAAVGNIMLNNQIFELIDLPGVYSICNCSNDIQALQISSSPSSTSLQTSIDEIKSCEFLRAKKANYIINIVDASHLQRDLYLTTQLLDMGYQLIVIINRIDIAKKKGINIDINKLQEMLNCPVITLNARKKSELKKLSTIFNKKSTLKSIFFNKHKNIIYTIKQEDPAYYLLLKNMIIDVNKFNKDLQEWEILRLIEGDDIITYTPHIEEKYKNAITKKIKEYDALSESEFGDLMDMFISNHRYNLIDKISNNTVAMNEKTKKINMDAIVLNNWCAIPIFLFILQIMFVFTINFGGYFQKIFENLTQLIFIDGIKIFLDNVLKSNLFTHFVNTQTNEYIEVFYNSMGNGLKMLLSFVPLIWSLYFFLAILEESGYMSRAAFTMERILNKFGLPGKAVIPLIIGFGCNVPAVMAARIIENKKQRIATIMMIPFMSCSARLAVFAMFCSVFFTTSAIYIIMLLHIAGIIIGLSTSYVFRQQLKETSSNINIHQNYFILELPDYNVPSISLLVKTANQKAMQFISGVGKMIMIVAICFNILSLININGEIIVDPKNSILANVAKIITPIFKPMGLRQDNWQATIGLLSGVLAKEVVVGTLSTLYETENSAIKLNNIVDNQNSAFDNWTNNLKNYFNGLINKSGISQKNMSNIDNVAVDNIVIDNDNTIEEINFKNMIVKKFHNDVGVIAYLFFILLYFPCISVYAVIKKEIGFRYALASAVWSTGIAYIAAVLFYQISITINVYNIGWSMAVCVLFTAIVIAGISSVMAKIIYSGER